MRVLTRPVFAAMAIMIASVASAGAAGAAGSVPSAANILFEVPQLSNLSTGSTLTYSLQQKVSDAKLLGAPIDDKITLTVAKVADNERRDVNIAMFTGDRARPLQELPGRTGNPLLVIFLERSVLSYSRLSGGPSTYIKNRFKSELAKHSTVEPTKVSFNGKQVDGYQISVTPFVRDPNRHKMRGYEGSTYNIIVSDAVPGYFVEFVAVLESPKDGAPRLEERITFTGAGDPK